MYISGQMAAERVKAFFTDHQKTTYSLNCFCYSPYDICLHEEFSRHFIVTINVVGIGKTSSDFPLMFQWI